ncbi:MAG: hypothetical protein PVSMB4_05840 [Ktedonobacterales bacterium]
MAAVTGLSLVAYLWNMTHALDYPEYDEAEYFNRGYHLLQGDFGIAGITNVNSSPLSVCYYALWYMLVHGPLLYPWVLASSLFLMGMGAYLLLSRVLHPALSWPLAVAAVIGSAPMDPWNGNYYLGAGLLWLSLALLDHRVWRRGLAALGVLITLYARPEFIVVLLLLLLGLAVYEWRAWRRKSVTRQSLALAYAPLALGVVLSAYLLASAPAGNDYRSAVALPWSYNDFYNSQYHEQFHGIDSYANPWVIYEKDFGPVPQHSLTATLTALTRNPGKLREYVAFGVIRLWAAFGTSALSSYRWRSDAWETRLQVDITQQDTAQFGLGVLVFLRVAVAGHQWLRHTRQLRAVPIQLHGPALIGLGSLAALLVPLVLINPHQRFFMLFPLVLALVGYGLTLIGTAGVLFVAPLTARMVAIRPWSLTSATSRRSALLAYVPVALTFVLSLLVTPQPFSATPPHPIARTLDFLRAHVPQGSVIVGEPASSYAHYLDAEGLHLRTLSPADYPGAGFVGAFEADPSVRYALLTRAYPQSVYDQWFAQWRATFPQLPWTLAARDQNPELQLYTLPPHSDGYGQVSYALWLHQARQLNLNTAALPPFSALDFRESLPWRSANPGHVVQPTVRFTWNVPMNCFVMHPYYPGLEAYHDVSSQVETRIPPGGAGRRLLFFAALAPWAASQPDAQGTRLTFAIAQSGYSKTVEVLNEPQPHWIPIVVNLPPTTTLTNLSITITPRTSINDDTTLLSYVGMAQP